MTLIAVSYLAPLTPGQVFHRSEALLWKPKTSASTLLPVESNPLNSVSSNEPWWLLIMQGLSSPSLFPGDIKARCSHTFDT